jgi:phosphatidate cytidylyltransferase
MYKALKNLSATEQIGALFIIVFGLLLLAGIVVFLLSMRESEDANTSHRRSCDIENLSKLLKTSWMMIFVFWVAWISGD